MTPQQIGIMQVLKAFYDSLRRLPPEMGRFALVTLGTAGLTLLASILGMTEEPFIAVLLMTLKHSCLTSLQSLVNCRETPESVPVDTKIEL
jgi:hypothetical protein